MTLKVTIEDTNNPGPGLLAEIHFVRTDMESEGRHDFVVQCLCAHPPANVRFSLFRHKRGDGWAKLLKRALYLAMEANPNFGKML